MLTDKTVPPLSKTLFLMMIPNRSYAMNSFKNVLTPNISATWKASLYSTPMMNANGINTYEQINCGKNK